MQRRRIILEDLSESERQQFLPAFVNRYAQALRTQFPPQAGYEISWDDECTWQISAGKFRGLLISLFQKDPSLKVLDLTIEAFFPAVRRCTEAAGSFANRWYERIDPAKWILGHFLIAFLVLPIMIFLPFIALYRLSLLSLSAESLEATRLLDALWPEIQASWAGRVVLVPQRSPVVTYFLAAAATTAASSACFRLAILPNMGEAWTTALAIATVILAGLSLILIIALALTTLGFEVTS